MKKSNKALEFMITGSCSADGVEQFGFTDGNGLNISEVIGYFIDHCEDWIRDVDLGLFVDCTSVELILTKIDGSSFVSSDFDDVDISLLEQFTGYTGGLIGSALTFKAL